MSKRTRRKRKPKTESVEAQIGPSFSPVIDVEEETVVKELTPTQKEAEAILLQAPVLEWNFNITYVSTEFRKAMVAMRREFVKLHELPYNVDQTGALTLIV